MRKRRLFAFVFVLATIPLAAFLVQQHQEYSHRAATAFPSSDWPMYLHDIERSAANSSESTLSPSTAGNLTKLWSFKTGGVIAASPTVVGNTVYVGSWDGSMYALDAMTGQQRWKTYLGQSHYPHCGTFQQQMGVTSAATVEQGVVYVAGGDGNFYALDASSGAVLWKVFLGDPAHGYYTYSSPLLYNGNVYYGTASSCDNPLVRGQLFQISLRTHTITNTFNVVPSGQTGGALWTSPSVDPTTNTIYLSTGNGGGFSFSLVALDASTLTVKGSWQVPSSQEVTDSDWGTTPTVFTTQSGMHMLTANNKNGNVYVFHADTLSSGPVWQKNIATGGDCPECGQGSIASSTFANNSLYVAGGNTTIHGISYKGAVRAFDPTTGNVLWEQGTSGPVLSALAYANNLIVAGAGSALEVLNATSGTPLYQFTTGGPIYSAPAIANGEIFVGSTDMHVYAFGVPSSQLRSTRAVIPSLTQQPSQSSTGFLHVSGTHLVDGQGHTVRLYGATMYPATFQGNGWASTNFPTFIDTILAMATQAHLNTLRVTDMLQYGDWHTNILWTNLDNFVSHAAQRHIWVILDLSTFRNALNAQGKFAYNPADWQAFINFVAGRYKNAPNIAYYEIAGEPQDPDRDAGREPTAQQLVTFYQSVSDMIYAADGNHLVGTGSFAHLNEQQNLNGSCTPSPSLCIPWQTIYALPHIDVPGIHIYSDDDLHITLPMVQQWTAARNKPFSIDEFGFQQGMGDQQRASAFDTIYNTAQNYGNNVNFIFWNLGPQLAPTSYEVNPHTPLTWQVVQSHAPLPSTN